MDGKAYSLVPLPPEQRTLVPVCTTLVTDHDSGDESEADAFGLLWDCLCKLVVLLWFALLALRRLRLQLVELRWQANNWKALHQRAVRRQAGLTEQIQQLQGEIRELKRRLFGRKSEASTSANPKAQGPPSNPHQRNRKPRSRGQQPGGKGHGRRKHDHLPTEHEACVLPQNQRCCPDCGAPYQEIPGTADGDILEIDVRAHRRRYHRQRYRRRCACPNQPALITASPPDKLIPKSNLGVSLWVLLLQRKFQFFQPLYRVLAELRSRDLHLPAGTITDGLRKLVPLLQPLYQLLTEHNRTAQHWHCDETRWPVFVKQRHKAGFAWTLWVFAAKESVLFVLDPTRAHDVPEGHLGAAEGIINVDRYRAYQAMAQVKAGKILLAFCWAHVRRDFLAVLTSWPDLTDWSWSWIEDIGLLYQRNDQRLSAPQDATAYAQADRLVREQVTHMRQRFETELALPNLHPSQRKTLKSLQKHWSGLTVFVDHPEVPLDNNTAERCHRGPVVGRKNFYGSGALWSGRLAAMLFSLFQTIQLWGMDVGKWLAAYLSACAAAQGKPPPKPERFLPWNMTHQERQRLSLAKPQPSASKSRQAPAPICP
jgi:transposase